MTTITGRRPVGRPKKRSANGPQYDAITVQLPPDLVAALDGVAVAEGVDSRSEVIRRACRRYLKRAEKRINGANTSLPAASA